jgi:chromosome segregation ATPase
MPEPTSYAAIGWILGALVGLIVAMNQIDDFIKRRRGHPGNEELKGGADVMSARLTAVEREQEQAMVRRRAMHDKIDAGQRALREEWKQDIEAIYSEINKLREGQSKLNTNDEHQNRHLAHIEGKLDRLIERMFK